MSAARTIVMKDGRPALIRPVRRGDCESLFETERAVTEAGVGVVRDPDELPKSSREFMNDIEAYFEGNVRSGYGGLMLVAEVEGRAIGAGTIKRYKPARLRHNATIGLGIHPDYQGLGLGRAITEGLIEWARTGEGEGITRVELCVFSHNTPARRLYESLGFEVEGCRRGFIRDRDGVDRDDIAMALAIRRTDRASEG